MTANTWWRLAGRRTGPSSGAFGAMWPPQCCSPAFQASPRLRHAAAPAAGPLIATMHLAPTAPGFRGDKTDGVGIAFPPNGAVLARKSSGLVIKLARAHRVHVARRLGAPMPHGCSGARPYLPHRPCFLFAVSHRRVRPSRVGFRWSCVSKLNASAILAHRRMHMVIQRRACPLWFQHNKRLTVMIAPSRRRVAMNRAAMGFHFSGRIKARGRLFYAKGLRGKCLLDVDHIKVHSLLVRFSPEAPRPLAPDRCPIIPLGRTPAMSITDDPRAGRQAAALAARLPPPITHGAPRH